MVPVCDKRYHIYNRFRHFWAEIKKLWNYPLLKYEQLYIAQINDNDDYDDTWLRTTGIKYVLHYIKLAS